MVNNRTNSIRSNSAGYLGSKKDGQGISTLPVFLSAFAPMSHDDFGERALAEVEISLDG